MANISNVRIGVCSVKFGGVDLGHTKDGVEFHFERDFEDLTVDQYGSTPIDKALTGQNLTVVLSLAEPTLDNLNVAIPEGSHAQAGSGATLKERLSLGADAGYLLRQDAKPLILHPIKNASTDDSEDITIYQAVSIDEVELDYKIDDQRMNPLSA